MKIMCIGISILKWGYAGYKFAVVLFKFENLIAVFPKVKDQIL